MSGGMERMTCAEEDDEETHRSDMEVASVFSRGIPGTRSAGTRSAGASPYKRINSTPVTPAKYNYSPFRPSTVMTNVSRGNVRTTTPCVVPTLSLHQMAAQGELLLLQNELKDHDVNEKDGLGFTPAMWAAANNQVATLKFLQENGADFGLTAHQAETALLLAATNGHTQVLQVLLSAGVEVNHICQNNNSALCYAVYNNHVESVKMLLEWGADMTIRNKDNHCAIDIAVLQGNKDVQLAIEKHMLSLLDPT